MKPVLISGIQPSGRLHIGNYLGALKNFVDLQNSGEYKCYFFIADLHALTENPDPKDLHENILSLAADFLAAGLDPDKSVIFLQSQVPAHNELAWIFSTITPLGKMFGMTQFKDKTSFYEILNARIKKFAGEQLKLTKQEAQKEYEKLFSDAEAKYLNVSLKFNSGLLFYPVLMASDILMYNAERVPIGQDQQQHLELVREIARGFNIRFGKTFVEPQPKFTELQRVMSLDDPLKKMSKSRPSGCLFLDDLPEETRKKIKKAVTDSEREMKERGPLASSAGIRNLILINSSLSGQAQQIILEKFKGVGYAEFKKDLAELIVGYFEDYRADKKRLLTNPSDLIDILRSGSEQAAIVAEKKIKEVKEKIGIEI